MNSTSKINFHTHTYLCRHAEGTVAEHCAAALSAGVEVLGFSEHNPYPDDRAWRMSMEEFETVYLSGIRKAQSEYPGLKIFTGLEMDIDENMSIAEAQDLFLGKYKLDYLIAGVHGLTKPEEKYLRAGAEPFFTVETIREYVEEYIRLIESKVFLYVAHPDIWAMRAAQWTSEIAAVCKELFAAAKDCGVPVEINASGARKTEISTPDGTRKQYPWRPFWELAAETGGLQVVMGMDAHDPADAWSNGDETLDFARSLGFEPVNLQLAEQLLRKSAENPCSSAGCV